MDQVPIRIVLACAIGFAAFVAGCGPMIAAGMMKSAARDRAVVDLNCPEDDIQVEDVGGGAHRTTGCGLTATYVCAAGGTIVCVREKDPEKAKAAPVAAAAKPSSNPSEASSASSKPVQTPGPSSFSPR